MNMNMKTINYTTNYVTYNNSIPYNSVNNLNIVNNAFNNNNNNNNNYIINSPQTIIVQKPTPLIPYAKLINYNK